MEFDCKFSVGLLDFFARHRSLDLKHFVIIAFGHIAIVELRQASGKQSRWRDGPVDPEVYSLFAIAE